MPLETESRAQIRALIADLRPDHGDLLAALHRVQHEYGFLSREAMEVVGEQLHLFAAQVYGAASYYEEFRFDPPALVDIRWCSGPACRARNGGGIRDAMLATLGVPMDGPTEDGRVGIRLGQCIGTCELAPQVWVEERATHTNEVVGHLNAAKAVRLARALKDGASAQDVLNGREAHGG
ncbi:MAG: NAD(P)H-dependent oxidoreductase subunit E [Chloroflexota bacterium]